ncbi:hypothetical protein CONLIGDRAFT_691971 [Coniochaeta ligniaria NRRL 30616]|uniref:Uncharacterized protein n=1 Tax=Coniochaeta ligniaria NRRL 30616 TaxID=1408157 RepID=A0A1J7J604_9PEZI|nr:hypothetical protein CONLIGDRAFT_691971 [Coniochaeta ligniaria NRRL 30616]
MAQTVGQLVGPMLWLVPRYPETPGSIMRLGSILKDSADLESSLNLPAIPAIPDADRRDASTAVRRRVQAELHKSDSFFVKAAPSIAALFGAEIGASAGAGRDREVTTALDVLDVHATVFIPSEAYMETALSDEGVRKYVRESLFGKRLYVVVGVATAGRLSVQEARSAGHFAELKAAATLPGGLGEGEAAFEHNRAAMTETEHDVDKACDFAYRARAFFYSKVRKRLVDEGNVTESALFGDDGDKSAVGDDGFVDIPKFEWFEDEDASAGGDVVTITVSDVAEDGIA